ncbi:Serine/threonine-protein phosphatase 6 regulatory ankyrin repeat subunit B [Cercospora beticola]|uniref:Serine/threonine-protein phosphatase 6 regulatory ankyrin repeat subunit B n=1 Tax=Cercospora beticola TaxID=122368 RepID=A0A2G5I8B1_CERBT|nr:Serine/threonine-protein phosphatase 6 regulatory ankyrin repeat subunit B [Cercospora beticola]PIB01047.1 Serine/threonine-protein phosphatase 6 regulatory ankyrin repeat subunit B [Cercospora beticola]WPA97609.1 hypothetical protein RHO25_002219 [Cercospora beticola]
MALKHQLRHSEQSEGCIMRFLTELEDNITDANEIIRDGRIPYDELDFSDSDASHSSLADSADGRTELEQIIDDIADIVTGLFDLTRFVSRACPSDLAIKASNLNMTRFNLSDENEALIEFPGASREIINRLIEASHRRRQILTYLHEIEPTHSDADSKADRFRLSRPKLVEGLVPDTASESDDEKRKQSYLQMGAYPYHIEIPRVTDLESWSLWSSSTAKWSGFNTKGHTGENGDADDVLGFPDSQSRDGATQQLQGPENDFLDAANSGDMAQVKTLYTQIRSEGNPNRQELGRKALLEGSKTGHTGLVEFLLEEGQILSDFSDTRGRTPLWWAAENGHAEVVRLLIQDPTGYIDETDESNDTALSRTVEKGSADVVQMLVESKAVVRFAHIYKAAKNDHKDILRYLLTYAEDANEGNRNYAEHLLHGSAFYDLPELMTKVLALGVNVNAVDRQSRTALHESATSGSARTADILLNQGADVNSLDQGRQTPIWIAATSGHTEVVRLMLQRPHEVSVSFLDYVDELLNRVPGTRQNTIYALLAAKKSALLAENPRRRLNTSWTDTSRTDTSWTNTSWTGTTRANPDTRPWLRTNPTHYGH